jgi:hypothetical protein
MPLTALAPLRIHDITASATRCVPREMATAAENVTWLACQRRTSSLHTRACRVRAIAEPDRRLVFSGLGIVAYAFLMSAFPCKRLPLESKAAVLIARQVNPEAGFHS